MARTNGIPVGRFTSVFPLSAPHPWLVQVLWNGANLPVNECLDIEPSHCDRVNLHKLAPWAIGWNDHEWQLANSVIHSHRQNCWRQASIVEPVRIPSSALNVG